MGSWSAALRARPPAASATAAAELGIEELCDELAVAGGRNDDWPATRCCIPELPNVFIPMAFDGPPMPGRLGKLKIDDEPKRGLVSLKIPRAIAVAFGIPLSNGLVASIGPE